jgi:hypothetical protein
MRPLSKKPRKPSLEELIAQCDMSAPLPDDLQDWLDIAPIGGEILPPWDYPELQDEALTNSSQN